MGRACYSSLFDSGTRGRGGGGREAEAASAGAGPGGRGGTVSPAPPALTPPCCFPLPTRTLGAPPGDRHPAGNPSLALPPPVLFSSTPSRTTPLRRPDPPGLAFPQPSLFHFPELGLSPAGSVTLCLVQPGSLPPTPQCVLPCSARGTFWGSVSLVSRAGFFRPVSRGSKGGGSPYPLMAPPPQPPLPRSPCSSL